MKKFYLILTCAALCACGGGNKQQASTTSEKATEEKQTSMYPIHIPFEEGMEVEREVKLSEIADSVTYIRLETTDKGLVKYTFDLSSVTLNNQLAFGLMTGVDRAVWITEITFSKPAV